MSRADVTDPTPDDLARFLRGSPVVLSVSGGKDSTATALYLRELGLDFTMVFADTGWEHPATYAYLSEVLEPLLGSIHRVHSTRGGMSEWVQHKSSFPGRLRRWCTDELKVFPIRDYLATLDDPVNVVGIRAEESTARSALPEWDFSEQVDATVWRPILRWTTQDVIDIHQKYGVVPNPLYLHGAERVGCFPCIYARKAEIRLVAALWEARIDEIAAMEAVLSAQAREQAARRRETPWPSGVPLDDPREQAARDPHNWRHARTFFGAGEKGRGWADYGIRTVVAWSQTDRRGSPLDELESRPTDEGCMRWGFCEHPRASRAEVLVQVADPTADGNSGE